jgi:hypothetical protein
MTDSLSHSELPLGTTLSLHQFTTPEPTIDEEIWIAWVEKGRRQEAATNRRLRVLFGLAVVLATLGGGFYRVAAK